MVAPTVESMATSATPSASSSSREQPPPAPLVDLRAAITSGDVAKVRHTLALVVERDAQAPLAWENESFGLLDATPCELAARSANLDVLQVLIASIQPQLADSSASTPAFWLRVIDAAVVSGKPAILELVLRKMSDSEQNEAILEGHAPLFAAVRRDEPEMLLLLLNHGASLETARNPQGQCALHVAVENDAAKCFDLVLTTSSMKDTADRHGHTPLHYAVEFGRVEMARQLVLAGADANARSAVRLLTPLHLAVRSARLELVRLFVSTIEEGGAGADPNAVGLGGKTPLHDVFAIDLDTLDNASGGGSGNHTGSVTDDGDDSVLEDEDEDEDMDDAEGRAEKLQCEIARLLLVHGADPNILDASPGFSPLHLAIRNECDRAVELLLAHGADANTRTASEGLTALHVAAFFDASVAVWRSLLDAGADVTLENEQGKRALELVDDEDKAREIAALLS